jgi:hypothetical protein
MSVKLGIIPEIDRAHEQRVRRKARRLDHVLFKSRERKYVPHSNNYGAYMLVNWNNCVVLGELFDATLDDIESYLSRV